MLRLTATSITTRYVYYLHLIHGKDGKAPGLCNITAEMLKAAGPDDIEWLTAICRTAWEQGIIPED